MEEFISRLLRIMYVHYWQEIKDVVSKDKKLKKSIPTFLMHPNEIYIYVGKEHLAIEYLDPYNFSISNMQGTKVKCFDFTGKENFAEEIIGINFDQGSMTLSLEGIIDDLYIATTEATEVLVENNWNFLYEEMNFMVNISGISLGEGFKRIRNSFFYEKNNNGLKVRNVKWLDIFPIERNIVNGDIEDVEVSFPNLPLLALKDAYYTTTEKLSFQYNKLKILNRFIELYNTEGVLEVEITQFLAEPSHQFILKMSFFGDEVHCEKECNWTDDEDRAAIRPDYFISGTNGFSDIVEFKLPKLKTNNIIVGKENRETFSAEIQSYISQTRVYREYFDDPRNQELVKNKHGITVYYPKRFLVIGRRWMFEPKVWRAIENEFSHLTIRTYDDIVDTVMSHLMT
ncbi:hypothetical protein [Priestia megaterium]|uniref:hypothetical protein n=1 Tax=Priestia megaterium TaxID=1404 RepID=UPI00406BC4A1